MSHSNVSLQDIIFYNGNKTNIIGENINMLMPEPDHSQHDQYLKRYQETRDPHIIGKGREVKGKKKNGTQFPFRLAVSEVQYVKFHRMSVSIEQSNVGV